MKWLPTIGCSCGLFLFVITPPLLADESLASRLPPGAIATLEFFRLGPLIERIRTSDELKMVLDSPQWQEAIKQEPVQKAIAGKILAEGQLGMSLWEFAKTYFGDRSILGIYPPSQPGGPPDGVAIIRVKDAGALEKLWERLAPLLPLAGEKVKVGVAEGGGRLLTFDDGNQLVIRDRWIVLSRVKSRLDQTIRNLSENDSTRTALADSPAWKSMAAQLGTDHEVQFCLDMNALNSLAGHRVIPTKLDNGFVSLLFGGYLELAAHSPYLGSTIDVHENHFEWRTSVAGDPHSINSAHSPFVAEGEGIPQASVPKSDRPLNGFSLTRDFAGWYRNREALLDAKLLPGFDKFETGIAPFLSGRDFGEDVLPLLGRRLTIITAPQSYEHLQGKPGVQLPAIAILLDLAKPAEAKDLLNLVFQSVILISNLQAAQEGRQPFVLSSESYRETQIAYAKYLKQPEGETLPVAANFQPASARIGNRFVITTNVAMCRNLIDTLQAESDVANVTEPTALPAAADQVRDLYFDLSPSIAADLLEANSAIIHAQNLQQGKSSQQSSQELDAFLKLLRKLTPIRFTSTRCADRWALEFRGGWN